MQLWTCYVSRNVCCKFHQLSTNARNSLTHQSENITSRCVTHSPASRETETNHQKVMKANTAELKV